MDTTTLTEEATLKRFNARQDRIADDFGAGDTEGALGITRDALVPLSEFIQSRKEILSSLDKRTDEHALLAAVEKLPSETIALGILNSALASIAQCEDAVDTSAAIGATLQAEAWAAGLLEEDAKLAKRIEQTVRRKHGSLRYRQQAARSIATRCGYKAETWSRSLRVKAGQACIRYLLDALPGVFVYVTEDVKVPVLTLTPEALEVAESAIEHALRRQVSFYPCTEPPRPWTGFYDGGYWTWKSRFKAPVVRAYYPETRAAIKAALEDGSMQPTLDALNALNALQGTACPAAPQATCAVTGWAGYGDWLGTGRRSPNARVLQSVIRPAPARCSPSSHTTARPAPFGPRAH